MGYERDYRDHDRWRDRDQGGRSQERGSYDRDRDYGRGQQGGGGEDRGFFERAGEQVRSWFSDDDDGRRNERGDGGRGPGSLGGGGFGGGWGNQQGESWNRERPGERGGWGGGSGDQERYGGGGYGGPRGGQQESWGGSGFGGNSDRGRRFDRVDAGSTGTHGAHPMSYPVGGYGTGQGSSARSAAILGQSGGRGGDLHDPHYSEWRNRQIEELDRDYDEYRREHQSKFEQEFGSWREKRQGQRQSMGKVNEQMEVLGSDGQHLGTVDKVRGNRIILTKSDENAGGIHHSIPCSWIESVDEKVTLNRTAQQAMDEWRNEERNRALFEREDQGSQGPHMLNRSFSGTY